MEINRLISSFENELKSRVNQRAFSSSPEKLLLEAFKHYDITNSDKTDFRTFKKVITVKLGISLFSDEDINKVFDFYTRPDPHLVYRAFISQIYGVNMFNSVRLKPQSDRISNSFTNNKHDKVDQSAPIKKLLEFIIFKLRKGPLSGFLRFYRDLVEEDRDRRGAVGVGEFSMVLKKNDIRINQEDIKGIWLFFNSRGDGLEIEKLIDCLCVNFKGDRIGHVRTMFSRLDFMDTGKINIKMLSDLFNARIHFDVKNGRRVADQLQMEFEESIIIFAKINNSQPIIDTRMFLKLFKLFSGHVDKDSDFRQFIDKCFRYNEIPRQNDQVMHEKTKQNYKGNANDDMYSTYSSLNLDQVLIDLDSQVAKKGNAAYIKLYKTLRRNDYDRDGYLYLKDFEKCIREVRVQLDEKRIKKIFDAYTTDKARINYRVLLQNLIPAFKDQREVYVRDLYTRILESTKNDQLTYQRVIASFFVRGHPDFKTGSRQDFEISEEFKDGLRDFLICFQGNHMDVPWPAFLRFFEFFGRNWSAAYLQNIVSLSFKTNSKSVYSSNKANNESPFAKKPDQKNSKFYEEFNKSQKNLSKPKSPFYTEDEQANRYPNRFAKKESPSKLDRPYHVDDQLQQRQQGYPERSRRRSEFSMNNDFDEFTVKTPLSPDDGSVVSQSHYEQSIRNLNTKLQKTITSMSNLTIKDASGPTSILRANIRASGKIPIILEVESEMTERSDQSGCVDYEIFSTVLDRHNLLGGLDDHNLHALFLGKLNNDNKLHVQTFCNDLRGQMDKKREDLTVDLFDRITPGKMQEIPFTVLRKVFDAREFAFGNYRAEGQKRTMLDRVIELFSALNLGGKARDRLDLDDFLYMFDNFAFFLEGIQDYKRFLDRVFK